MKKKSFYLSSILAMFIAGNAFAEGVEFGVGYAGYENPYDIDDSKGIKLNLGYRFAGDWAIELSHADIDGVVENNGDDRFSHDSVNVLYHFGDGRFQSYLLAGLGAYAGNGGGSVAFGLKLRMGNFELRPEIGAVNAFSESNGTETLDGMTSLSLSYLFKSSETPKAPVITPKSAPVIIDADGDGIADTADQCADTPSGAPIDSLGCPLDGDKDGIIDYFDRCATTDFGLKVDEQGCPVKLMEDVSISLNVNFDSGSAVVKAEYFPEIAKAANFLEQYENTTVVIEGHTDSRGAASANMALSERRASAVAQVLVDIFKVAADRVSWRGYGESRPIDDESTPAGLLKNRRVVAEIKVVVERFETK